MLTARKRMTFVRAAPTGTDKKKESANAIVMAASPATIKE
jgi:hypothetical protein